MLSKDVAPPVPAPHSYEDLYRIYWPHVVNLVRTLGIEPDSVEDVASAILARFWERDFLAQYDPTRTTDRFGDDRVVGFKAFLSAFVRVYVQSHRERQHRVRRRELLLCDSPVGDSGARWIEVLGLTSSESVEAQVEAQLSIDLLIESMRSHLASVPRRSRMDRCDLVTLFDVVMASFRSTGFVSVPAIQAAFGISETAAHTWLVRMRQCLREVAL
jgi:DNA-directed RNA polymerase specialized sigma24 family protein